jgi:Secretion system C-terminal sorting domain
MKAIILLIFLSFSNFIYAQNLFQDNFESYNATQLNGQGKWSNDPALGGLGNCVGSGCINALILPETIGYPGYGSSDNALEVFPNKDGVGTTFPSVKTGDLYVSFIINLSKVQDNNNSDFFRVMNLSNLTTTFRLYVTPSASGGFLVGAAKGANGNPITFTTRSFTLNTDHLIVMKYRQLPNTDDDFLTMYIDPVFSNGIPASTDVFVVTGLDQSGEIDRLAFRNNWTNGMPTGRVGLPSVAKSWAALKFQGVAVSDLSEREFTMISNEMKDGILKIKSSKQLDDLNIEIFDLLGKLIENKKITLAEGINTIPISPIDQSGLYFVRITNGTKTSYSQKVLIDIF